MGAVKKPYFTPEQYLEVLKEQCDAHGGPVHPRQVAKATGVSCAAAYVALRRLYLRGLAAAERYGRQTLYRPRPRPASPTLCGACPAARAVRGSMGNVVYCLLLCRRRDAGENCAVPSSELRTMQEWFAAVLAERGIR